MKILLTLVVILGVSGCASNQEVELGGSSWRIENPKQALLGSYGIRTWGSNSEIGFVRHGFVTSAELDIMTSPSETVQFASQSDSELALTAQELVNLGINREESYTSGFVAVEKSIHSTDELVKFINEDLKSSDAAKWNADSIRIVTNIIVASKYKSTDKQLLSGQAEVDMLKVNGQADINVSSKSLREVSKAEDTIIAYKYARLCWEDKANGKVLYIQEEAPNPWYMFFSNMFDCPKGSLETRRLK